MKIEFFKAERYAEAYSLKEWPYRKHGFLWWFWRPKFIRGKLPSYYRWFTVQWFCFGIELKLNIPNKEGN